MLIDLRNIGIKSVNVTLPVKHRNALFNGNPQGAIGRAPDTSYRKAPSLQMGRCGAA